MSATGHAPTPRSSGPAVFLSYRTEDTRDVATGLAGLLREDLGGSSVFRDKDDLVAGQPWQPALAEAIDRSDAVVVLIGPAWAGPVDGPRLIDSPDDPVRREVEQALAAPARRSVVPVIVEGAPRPTSPPEFVDTLMRLHAPAVDRDRLGRRDSKDYQSVLVGVWASLKNQHQDSILVMGDQSPLAQARIDELIEQIRTGSPDEVHEISRFASGAAIITLRQARRAARRWPEVIVLADGLDRSPLLAARLAAVREHPELAGLVLVGAAAGSAATVGVTSFDTIAELVSTSGDAAAAAAAESASWAERALDFYHARPRVTWLAAAGTATAAGAAAIALAASPEVEVSVEHAGFEYTVTSAELRDNPPGEADAEQDPDPDTDHYLLHTELTNLGVDTEAVRFSQVPVSDVWTLRLRDGTTIPAEAIETFDTGWDQLTYTFLGAEEDEFLMSFPIEAGQSVSGAQLQVRLFDYEPTVVGLAAGPVETLRVPVEVLTPTYEGPLGFDDSLFRIEVNDAYASLEASVDEAGTPLPAPHSGHNNRAREGSVFVHFDVAMVPVDGSAVVAEPVPVVDGSAREDPEQRSDYAATNQPNETGREPVTYQAVVEVPTDASTVGIGFSYSGQPVDFTAELDPGFLDSFRPSGS